MSSRSRPLSIWEKENLLRNRNNEFNSMRLVQEMTSYLNPRPGKVFKTASERNAALKALKDEMRYSPQKPIKRLFQDTRVSLITPEDAVRLIGREIIIGRHYAEQLLPNKNNNNNGYGLEYYDVDDGDALNPTRIVIKSVDAQKVSVMSPGNRWVFFWSSNRQGPKVLVGEDGYPIIFFGSLSSRITKSDAARKIQRSYLAYRQRLKLESDRIRKQRNQMHNELRALPSGVFHPSFPGGANTLASKARFENMQRAERNLKRKATSNAGPKRSKR